MVMKSYQVRLMTEYDNLCNKYRKLLNYIRFVDANEPDIELNCPLELLKEQADVMKRYIDILLKRSMYEKMDLPVYDFNVEYPAGDDYE